MHTPAPACPPMVPPHGPALVILAIATGSFSIGTGEFSMMGLLPEVAADLHISVPDAGWLVTAYAAGVVVGAPLFAVLCARLPRRSLLIALMGVYAAGNLASGLAHGFIPVLLLRFLSALPHGAFFGIGALVAASMVPHDQRTRAVGQAMLGLTLATIIGAPLAAWCGRFIDWHAAYLAVGAIALLAMGLLAVALPPIPADDGASPLTELGALRRPLVWLALGTAAIGFGGLFAVYSYLVPALVARTHLAPVLAPLVLAVLGVGMAVGNTVGVRLVDRAPRRAIVLLLLWDIAVSLLFIPALPHLWAVVVDAFLIGCGIALGPALQTRLMDVAGDAQALAASLNHSAFNIANGAGAGFGGMAIAAGFGWTAPGWVGALLAAGGLLMFLVSLRVERRYQAKRASLPRGLPTT